MRFLIPLLFCLNCVGGFSQGLFTVSTDDKRFVLDTETLQQMPDLSIQRGNGAEIRPLPTFPAEDGENRIRVEDGVVTVYNLEPHGEDLTLEIEDLSSGKKYQNEIDPVVEDWYRFRYFSFHFGPPIHNKKWKARLYSPTKQYDEVLFRTPFDRLFTVERYPVDSILIDTGLSAGVFTGMHREANQYAFDFFLNPDSNLGVYRFLFVYVLDNTDFNTRVVPMAAYRLGSVDSTAKFSVRTRQKGQFSVYFVLGNGPDDLSDSEILYSVWAEGSYVAGWDFDETQQ